MSTCSTVPAAPMLNVDRLRALLDAGGYASAVVFVHGQHDLPVGCNVALEFGDRITRDVDGMTRMPIVCSVVLNGRERRVTGVTRWRIGKTLSMMIDQDRLLLTIDAELLLGSAVELDDVLLHGGEVLRHLRLLLADARATLASLPADDRRGAALPRRLRIEARFAANLAVGRCGLVRRRSADGDRFALPPVRIAMHQARRVSMAACDGLADHVLPDLTRAMRSTIGPDGYRDAAFRSSVRQDGPPASSREDDQVLTTSTTLQ
jgi:hypothetical protein